MVGTNIAQPIGQRIPKVMRIGIVIGEPLDFSRYKGMESDRFILRSVTDEIMYALMSLSGQEYVDVYAATQKARIASGHAGPRRRRRVAGGGPRRAPRARGPPTGPAGGRVRAVSRMTPVAARAVTTRSRARSGPTGPSPCPAPGRHGAHQREVLSPCRFVASRS